MLLGGIGKIFYVCLDTNACIQYLHQQLDIQERPISMASVRFVLQLLLPLLCITGVAVGQRAPSLFNI